MPNGHVASCHDSHAVSWPHADRHYSSQEGLGRYTETTSSGARGSGNKDKSSFKGTRARGAGGADGRDRRSCRLQFAERTARSKRGVGNTFSGNENTCRGSSLTSPISWFLAHFRPSAAVLRSAGESPSCVAITLISALWGSNATPHTDRAAWMSRPT